MLTTFDPFAYDFDRRARRALGSADYRRLARMDAIRRENDIELRFDLPGIDPESLDVTVDRGVLTVTARRAEEYTEGEKPFIRERVTGSYARRLRLSDAVDAATTEASYTGGAPTLPDPVMEQAKPRKIAARADATAPAA